MSQKENIKLYIKKTGNNYRVINNENIINTNPKESNDNYLNKSYEKKNLTNDKNNNCETQRKGVTNQKGNPKLRSWISCPCIYCNVIDENKIMLAALFALGQAKKDITTKRAKNMTSGSVNVNGHEIWYERFGSGSHPILFIPGAIGTGRTDFMPQIEGTNALNLKKYTLIAMEPIGWGRSRPPTREYHSEMYNQDAFYGNKIMEGLGFTLYSVMGWSDGAKTALLMASHYPSRVKSCIVWGIVTYATEKDLKAVVITKNIKFWGKDLIENYEKVYGSAWIELWTKHMDFLENILDYFPEGFVKRDLKQVQCPVFVLHGDQDPIVDVEHPLYVSKVITDCRLHRFPKGSHNLHITFPTEFKKLVENFLQDVDDGY